MADYEAIVIGAGNGGLTAAATLTRHGVRTLLLERHNVPGGCATSFCRGRFEFEVALHQLSGVGTEERPGPLRLLLSRLGVLDRLELVPMDDLYRVVIPEVIDITLKPDREAAVRALQAHFPAHRDGIAEWFDLLWALFGEVIGAFYFKDPQVTREKYPLFHRYALQTAAAEMDRCLKDPVLKTVASVYWTYLGLPPSRLALTDMAALYFAYSEFLPYHLRGGSQSLSNALAQSVLDAGGDIRFNCGVRRILVDDDGVAGVVTDAGDTITARQIVSNISKVATYVDLIEADRVPAAVLDELRQARIGPSAFTVYMGLDAQAADLGMTASTTFIVGDTDPDRVYARMFQREIGPRDGMLLTCYNAIDPGFSPPGTCQAAVVTLKYGESWRDVPPRDYADEKYRIAADMLGAAERVFPGLRGRIEEMEIATPLTHQRYLGHPDGAIYGFDHHIKDSSLFIANRPHIRGLYGAGGWYGSGGFQPTLESGVAAARAVLRHLNRWEAR